MQILLAITALALSALLGSRGIEQCNQQLFSGWTNTSAGDWFDSSNWCGGVPIFSSFTCISNGGTAQISTGTTAEACETFLGQNNCSPFCQNSGQSGNLSVDGGTLHTNNQMHVGYAGKGNVKIGNGGVVSTFGSDIAALAGSSGAVSVDGTNSHGIKSTWTMNGYALFVGGSNIGVGGTGLLTVTNNGMVTAASVHVYKSGTLTGNSSVTTTDGITIEGTLSPNGGTLSFGGNLLLQNAATTQCNVTPQDNAMSPQVSVSGQVSLDGRLSVTMTGDFSSAPTRYTLLRANTVDPLHPQFFSMSIKYPTDQGWYPKVSYDGGYVYLNRVYDLNP